ncbi:immunoglobulin E-set [Chaetomium sp. MPI-SDFR-AT-0129]|nr:immunoglobulin E-set [Chaetomium sp. MPI-SDFR-AT-0129]
MSSGRKISFIEPDMVALRANAASQGGIRSAGPPRCRSPYPFNVPKDDGDEEEDSNGTNSGYVSDEGDESLQRYKESLGLAADDLSDPNDPRVCIIQSLTMDSPGRAPVVIDLSAPGSVETLKKHPFKIKEGASFTMTAQFKVQHEILSGLHYVQAVKRKGIRVGKSSEMIGSYAPNTAKQPIYSKKFQEETAPSGWAARGSYTASSSFVDDDKKTHLEFDWAFEIDKDW